MDVVVLQGKEFDKFSEMDAYFLRMYRFVNGSVWEPIPFQLDEKAIVGGDEDPYFSGFKSPYLDAIDEVVFSAKDLGDKAPSDQNWPDDEESKNHPRYEIKVRDESTNKERYVYLFWAPSLQKSPRKYMKYENGSVTGITYRVGHNQNTASGLPDSLLIPIDVDGGEGKNALFRQRFRIYATVTRNLLQDLSVEIRENGTIRTDIKGEEEILGKKVLVKIGTLSFKVSFDKEEHIAGPIRIIRRNHMKLTIQVDILSGYEYFGLNDYGPADVPFSLGMMYFPHYYELPYDIFNIPLKTAIEKLTNAGASIKNTRILLGTVFNANVLGMRYYTPRLPDQTMRRNGLKIDNKPDQTVYQRYGYLTKDTDWPGTHWWAIVSDQAIPASPIKNMTLFMMANLRGPKPTTNNDYPAGQEIYYNDFDDWDIKYLYGNNGLQLFHKQSVPDPFILNLGLRQYVLPEILSYDQLEALFGNYEIPVQTTINVQYNDKISPGVITDLAIVNRTDTSVKIRWSAVPDDINGEQKVMKYLVRCSPNKPNNPHPDSLWKWWDQAGQSIYPGPVPAETGNPVEFTVSNLEKDRQYWFGVIAQDEAGNISQTIAMATSVTTPVELSYFAARPLADVIELQWTTASESNNLGFELQRRHESEVTWQTLIFLEGRGTITTESKYAWQDRPVRPGKIYYRLRQIDADGHSRLTDAISVAFRAPGAFALLQNYPNPFNPATTIHYEVPERSGQNVELLVYDLLGRKVRTLVSGAAEAGYYRTTWDGMDDRGVPAGAGVYFYVLTSGETRLTRKMIKVQ